MDANSLKRLVVAALSAGALVLNKKFGLELGDAEIAAIAGIVMTFLAGSNLRAIADKKAEAAAAEVKSSSDAAATLGGKVVP